MINSARYCRTFWAVGSSATLGVNSHFVGHIFATTSITANTGATVQGQLLAINGAVTLDSNTITNGICIVVVPVVEVPVVEAPVVEAPPAIVDSGSSDTTTVIIEEPIVEEPAIEEPTVVEVIDVIQPVIVVAPITLPVTTETGGQIPVTATPWYNLLFVGLGLLLVGISGKKAR